MLRGETTVEVEEGELVGEVGRVLSASAGVVLFLSGVWPVEAKKLRWGLRSRCTVVVAQVLSLRIAEDEAD